MVKSYVKLKDEELAEITMNETSEILKREMGEYNTLYLNILNNWANVYFENKNYKKSLELLEKCEKLCRIMLGTENKNYGDILKRLKIVKKEVDKKKIERYVWKNQVIKKIKKYKFCNFKKNNLVFKLDFYIKSILWELGKLWINWMTF